MSRFVKHECKTLNMVVLTQAPTDDLIPRSRVCYYANLNQISPPLYVVFTVKYVVVLEKYVLCRLLGSVERGATAFPDMEIRKGAKHGQSWGLKVLFVRSAPVASQTCGAFVIAKPLPEKTS